MQTGDTISHFRIVRPLGRGGMGEVYLAEDLRLGRRVALKFISPERALDATAIRRFEREARHAAELSHPGLAVLYDIDTTWNQPFLVIEYVPGETLAERLKRGPLAVEAIRHIGRSMADALAYAHARGFTHRDVKSANIMLTPEGGAKLLDLGLMTGPDSTRITRTDLVTGTPAYMSPEQIRGQEANGSSDIWSLGVVLYECATGRLPFLGENAVAVAYQVLHERPAPPRTLNPALPQDLERVILKCLEKEPARRHADAGMLSHALGDGISPAPAEPPPTRKTSLARWILGAAAGVVLATALLAGARRLLRSPGEQVEASQSTLAVVDFRDLTRSQDPQLAAGLTGLVQLGLTESSPYRPVSPELLYDVRRRLFSGSRGPIGEDEALAVARQAGAARLLSGQIGEARGERYLVWRLLDVQSGAVLASRRAEGNDPGALADQVVGEVTRQLARGGRFEAPGKITPVADISTASPEAYRHYVAGLQAINSGTSDDPAAEFEKAVALDSTFALAWFGLSQALDQNVAWDRVVSTAEKAWRHRERLGILDRLRLEAWRSRVHLAWDESIATYKEILNRWPDDRKTIEDLASLYVWGWFGEEAIRTAEAGLKLYPDDIDLATTRLACQGGAGRCREALRDYQALGARQYPGDRDWLRHHADAAPMDWIFWMYLMLGQPDSAEIVSSLRKTPGLQDRIRLAMARGDAESALKLCDRAIRKTSMSAADRRALLTLQAECQACVGRFDEALNTLHAAQPLIRDSRDRITLADMEIRLLAEAGRGQAAVPLATSLGAPPEPDRQRWGACWKDYLLARAWLAADSVTKAKDAWRSLSKESGWNGAFQLAVRVTAARIALREGKADSALHLLAHERDGPLNMIFSWDEHRLLAEVELAAGDSAGAERTLRRLLSINGICAGARYDLGKLYEKQGRLAEAASEYETFLKAWSNADPDQPQPADARRRLANLRRSGL